MMLRALSAVAVGSLLLALAGCAPAEGELGVLGNDACEPASPFMGNEIEGTASPGVTAFGLLETASPGDLHPDGQTQKLVVRMTGTGDMAGKLVAPDGGERALDWGPESHSRSNFGAAGGEWGVGISFDEGGCWGVALTRGGSDRAVFWFDVAAT